MFVRETVGSDSLGAVREQSEQTPVSRGTVNRYQSHSMPPSLTIDNKANISFGKNSDYSAAAKPREVRREFSWFFVLRTHGGLNIGSKECHSYSRLVSQQQIL